LYCLIIESLDGQQPVDVLAAEGLTSIVPQGQLLTFAISQPGWCNRDVNQQFEEARTIFHFRSGKQSFAFNPKSNK
jgi:hypothetical protein